MFYSILINKYEHSLCFQKNDHLRYDFLHSQYLYMYIYLIDWNSHRWLGTYGLFYSRNSLVKKFFYLLKCGKTYSDRYRSLYPIHTQTFEKSTYNTFVSENKNIEICQILSSNIQKKYKMIIAYFHQPINCSETRIYCIVFVWNIHHSNCLHSSSHNIQWIASCLSNNSRYSSICQRMYRMCLMFTS